MLGAQGLRTLEPSVRSKPLGLGPSPSVDEFPLEVGDRILFYTNGLSEGRSRDGAFFPLEQTAAKALLESDLEMALDHLLVHYRQHVDGMIRDDVALLLAAWSPERDQSGHLGHNDDHERQSTS